MFGRKLIVAHHRPVGKPLAALTILASLVLVAFFAYVYGTATLSIKFGAVRDERDRLGAQIASVEKENKELRERVTVLERAGQIDQKAYQDVDKHLLRLQMEMFALKEEVAFYRSIVSSKRKSGFHIQSFDVKTDSEQSAYRYLLVLTHDMKNDKVVSGTIFVSVAGEQNGRSKLLSYRDLGPDKSRGVAFRLKHFQKVEGRFVLPDGFSPHSITVHVVGADSKELVAEKTFNWPQPLS